MIYKIYRVLPEGSKLYIHPTHHTIYGICNLPFFLSLAMCTCTLCYSILFDLQTPPIKPACALDTDTSLATPPSPRDSIQPARSGIAAVPSGRLMRHANVCQRPDPIQSKSDPMRSARTETGSEARPGAVVDLCCICFHLEHNQCTQRCLPRALSPFCPRSLSDTLSDGVCCLSRCAINDAFRLPNLVAKH